MTTDKAKAALDRLYEHYTSTDGDLYISAHDDYEIIRQALQGWQPIETAANETRADLLWNGKRFTDCYRDPLDHGWRHMTHYNQLIMVNSPEYWTPLPPQPKTEGEK